MYVCVCMYSTSIHCQFVNTIFIFCVGERSSRYGTSHGIVHMVTIQYNTARLVWYHTYKYNTISYTIPCRFNGVCGRCTIDFDREFMEQYVIW